MSVDDQVEIELQGAADADLYPLPDRYENLGIIGQGGMGVVVKARDTQLDRTVAVKFLNLGNTGDDELQARFMREAKALSVMNHPSIVRLLSFGFNDRGQFYQVMEYLAGHPLQEEIGCGSPISLSRFNAIFGQILDALAHAHENGIIHRDVKPSNIIISESGAEPIAKLVDFGIVRFQNTGQAGGNTLTQTSALLGSPVYMSPEQCKGSVVDERSDIYSLGCVMYEALTGKPPHSGNSAMEVMYKRMSEKPELIGSKSRDEGIRRLGEFIDRCLCVEPGGRPQSASDALAQLQAILQTKIDTGKLAISRASNGKSSKVPLVMGSLAIIAVVAAGIAVAIGQRRVQSMVAQEEVDNIAKDRSRRNKDHIAHMTRLLKASEAKFNNAAAEGKRKQLAQDVLDAWEDLSQAQLEIRNYDSCEKSLNSAWKYPALIDGGPDEYNTAKLLTLLGQCKVAAGDFKGGAKYMEQAAKCSFGSPYLWNEIHFTEGKIDLFDGRYEEAIGHLKGMRMYIRQMYMHKKIRDFMLSKLKEGDVDHKLGEFVDMVPVDGRLPPEKQVELLRFLNELLKLCIEEKSDACERAARKALDVVAVYEKVNQSAEFRTEANKIGAQVDRADLSAAH